MHNQFTSLSREGNKNAAMSCNQQWIVPFNEVVYAFYAGYKGCDIQRVARMKCGVNLKWFDHKSGYCRCGPINAVIFISLSARRCLLQVNSTHYIRYGSSGLSTPSLPPNMTPISLQSGWYSGETGLQTTCVSTPYPQHHRPLSELIGVRLAGRRVSMV